jgi:membrane-bound metal-dependent hydrolase YbcI (DUF457 family)
VSALFSSSKAGDWAIARERIASHSLYTAFCLIYYYLSLPQLLKVMSLSAITLHCASRRFVVNAAVWLANVSPDGKHRFQPPFSLTAEQGEAVVSFAVAFVFVEAESGRWARGAFQVFAQLK